MIKQIPKTASATKPQQIQLQRNIPSDLPPPCVLKQQEGPNLQGLLAELSGYHFHLEKPSNRKWWKLDRWGCPGGVGGEDGKIGKGSLKQMVFGLIWFCCVFFGGGWVGGEIYVIL